MHSTVLCVFLSSMYIRSVVNILQTIFEVPCLVLKCLSLLCLSKCVRAYALVRVCTGLCCVCLKALELRLLQSSKCISASFFIRKLISTSQIGKVYRNIFSRKNMSTVACIFARHFMRWSIFAYHVECVDTSIHYKRCNDDVRRFFNFQRMICVPDDFDHSATCQTTVAMK